MRFIFFIACFLTVSIVKAQAIKGKVIGSENKLSIPHVYIFDEEGVLQDSTNTQGEFILDHPGLFMFSKMGYKKKQLLLEGDRLLIIELDERANDLSEVIIRSNHFETALKQITASISVIPKSQLTFNDGVNMAPVLNTVPGVYMHNGTLTTNRITIRGIGARNLFGTAKIRAYFHDIPLTNGSGETTVEDLELEGLARMEIRKGPSGSLYGAGLGGSIQLLPDMGLFNQFDLGTQYTIGSYGLQKFLLNTNLANQTNSAKITYSNTHSDGYRDNNRTDRQTITLATNHYLSDRDNLHVLANFIDLKAFIPSSLNEEDYLMDPTKAAFTWQQAKGFEDYRRSMLGLSWKHNYNDKAQQFTSVYGSLLDSYEARPFNIQEQDTRAIGLRSRFLHQTSLFDRELSWTAGLELFLDRNDLKTFENLYKEFPPGTGSVQGEQIGSLVEDRFYSNLFAEMNWWLTSKLKLDFGLNLNNTAYDLTDNHNQEDDNQSASHRFDPVLSPKIGLSYSIHPSHTLFALASHGFSPPKLEETLLPDGMINPDIQPETGWNYELGSRGSFLNQFFSYSISLYYMDIRDLLVARRIGDDQYVGVNAGQTIHKGLELELNYKIINSDNWQLSHSNSLSVNNYQFEDFEDGDNDYSGNDLTGVPDLTFFTQLHLEGLAGFYSNLNYQYIGQIPVNDANTVFTDPYQLLNLKVGYSRLFGDHWSFSIFGGINNLFDEKYASMLQINASSFGGNAPRYYYPGLPRNYYLGANLRYQF